MRPAFSSRQATLSSRKPIGEDLLHPELDFIHPETVVLAPSGVEHGVENTGELRLTLLVLMAPNPNVV